MTVNKSSTLEVDNAVALEYIKVQWADIHHSRLQEWSAFGVIGGTLYAMVNMNATEPKILLGFFGLFSATLGALMAWQHHQIFKDKITVIRKLELGLGIQYPSRSSLFPVQILIFLLFGGIAGAFAGATVYFWSGSPSNANLLAGVGVFFVFFVCALAFQPSRTRRQAFSYDSPYYAELDQLESCLELLGDRPLKLITDDYLTQSKLNEVRWDSAKWIYSVAGNVITKSVLLNNTFANCANHLSVDKLYKNRDVLDHKSRFLPDFARTVGRVPASFARIIFWRKYWLNQRDIFQFSVANKSSRQDWHYHNSTFEIYVSNEPMRLEYKARSESKAKSPVVVNKGALIVPPSLPHKVTLSGTTFVFQASVACKNLGRDKIVVEEG